MSLRLSVAVCAVTLAIPAAADTITYVLGPFFIDNGPSCGSLYACSPFDFNVPLFDASQGTLAEIDWSFTDYQRWVGGINDEDGPPGILWSADFTSGDTSSDLGFNISKTTLETGNTAVIQIISAGNYFNFCGLSASGETTDTSGWIGLGSLGLSVVPYASVDVLTGGIPSGPVMAGIFDIQDYATLDVTYTYTPEPRGYAALIALALIALVVAQRESVRKGFTHQQPRKA